MTQKTQRSHMDLRGFEGPLAEHLRGKRPETGVSIVWLGQAGFVVDSASTRIVIDPYLSNSLEGKYAGTAFPHPRMAPAPIMPADVTGVDLVLCTHHHTDHMDGETLRAMANANPNVRFVVPAAARSLARDRVGVGDDRLILADAGDLLEPIAGVLIHVFRAAHETLERDADGHHKYLGYGFTLSGVRLFHSGDTIPFDGQDSEVSAFEPDVALLPVNGRSTALSDAGFAGNFSLEEAVALCTRCGVPAMIAHHYGLFAFNTADPAIIDGQAEAVPFELQRARFQVAFRWPVD